jgi:hypothetical protein
LLAGDFMKFSAGAQTGEWLMCVRWVELRFQMFVVSCHNLIREVWRGEHKISAKHNRTENWIREENRLEQNPQPRPVQLRPVTHMPVVGWRWTKQQGSQQYLWVYYVSVFIR